MPGPLPPPVELTSEERRGLEALVRRHAAPQQVAARARIVLLAAGGLNNSRIARRLGLEADTVRLWRVESGPADRLERHRRDLSAWRRPRRRA